MVVVIIFHLAGIKQRGLPFGQVEGVYITIHVIKQCFAVGHPVGGLNGFGMVENYLSVARRYIQYFQVTGQIIAVGYHALAHRNADADIAEKPFLQHVFIMRTNKQTHVHLLTQSQFRDLLRYEGFAKLSHPHGVGVAFAFQLNHIGVGYFGAYFFGVGPGCFSKLQGGQAVAMHHRVDMGRFWVQTGSGHPAYFPVRVNAFPQQFGPAVEDKVAGHFFST